MSSIPLPPRPNGAGLPPRPGGPPIPASTTLPSAESTSKPGFTKLPSTSASTTLSSAETASHPGFTKVPSTTSTTSSTPAPIPQPTPSAPTTIPSRPQTSAAESAAPAAALHPEKESAQILDSLARESKEWDKDSEIARILSTFALDAYSILDLQPGIPESAIVAAYRKKSLLIHPDKTTNPSAPAAFDKLKKAQTELLDEKARGRLDEAIADARMLMMRERGLTKDSEEMKPDSMGEEIRQAWREKTKFVLVENEIRRRKQLKVQMAEEGRELKRVEEEAAERKRKREAEVAWEKGREERISSWRDFAGGKPGGEPAAGTKKKKQKMKVLG